MDSLHRTLPVKPAFLWIVAVSVIFNLGCSLGALVVQAPTATPTRDKTPRATYTFTPDWTPTFTPSATPTETPTATMTPTATLTPSEATEGAEAAQAEAPPPPPPPPPPAEEAPAPPSPEVPEATTEPEFPFQVNYFVHDTGSPGETRMTAWIRRDFDPGIFKTLEGFQMRALAPDGNAYLSEISGPGAGDSTVKGTGDNHNMNTKLEFPPYTPGLYKITLVEGGVQVSPEIEITLSEEPMQYVHFDFFEQAPAE